MQAKSSVQLTHTRLAANIYSRASRPTSISSRNAVSQATWFTDEVTIPKRRNIRSSCMCVHEWDRYWFEKWACICTFVKKNEYISTLFVFWGYKESLEYIALYPWCSRKCLYGMKAAHKAGEACWYVWTKSEHLLVQSNLCIVYAVCVYAWNCLCVCALYVETFKVRRICMYSECQRHAFC